MTGGTEDGITKSMRSAPNGANAIPHGPELLIHPNPANAWVAFDYDLQVEPVNAFLIIRDLAGKEVYRLALNAQEQQVVWHTRSIPSGSYTVHLLNKERDLRTEKLIIQE